MRRRPEGERTLDAGFHDIIAAIRRDILIIKWQLAAGIVIGLAILIIL